MPCVSCVKSRRRGEGRGGGSGPKGRGEEGRGREGKKAKQRKGGATEGTEATNKRVWAGGGVGAKHTGGEVARAPYLAVKLVLLPPASENVLAVVGTILVARFQPLWRTKGRYHTYIC